MSPVRTCDYKGIFARIARVFQSLPKQRRPWLPEGSSTIHLVLETIQEGVEPTCCAKDTGIS